MRVLDAKQTMKNLTDKKVKTKKKRQEKVSDMTQPAPREEKQPERNHET